jgi:hypothetical protein
MNKLKRKKMFAKSLQVTRPQGYALDWSARRVSHIPGIYEQSDRCDGHQFFHTFLDKKLFPIQNYMAKGFSTIQNKNY